MKKTEEILNENWPHHVEAPYDVVLRSMEEYAEQFKQKWVNVKDSLPKNTNLCLVFKINGVGLASYSEEDDSWIEIRNFKTIEYVGITHWMPLPEPPKQP